MKSINEVTLLGNLTKDPELKYVGNNQALCRVSIATSQSYKDKNDEWQEISQFNDVTFWGKQAEKIGTSNFKGDKMLIKGTVENNKYVDKDGKTVYTVQIRGKDYMSLANKREPIPEELVPDELPELNKKDVPEEAPKKEVKNDDEVPCLFRS